MKRTDIIYHYHTYNKVELTHQCKTEQGIENDENFIIVEILGDFEQVMVRNQYKMEYKINVNQLV